MLNFSSHLLWWCNTWWQCWVVCLRRIWVLVWRFLSLRQSRGSRHCCWLTQSALLGQSAFLQIWIGTLDGKTTQLLLYYAICIVWLCLCQGPSHPWGQVEKAARGLSQSKAREAIVWCFHLLAQVYSGRPIKYTLLLFVSRMNSRYALLSFVVVIVKTAALAISQQAMYCCLERVPFNRQHQCWYTKWCIAQPQQNLG